MSWVLFAINNNPNSTEILEDWRERGRKLSKLTKGENNVR